MDGNRRWARENKLPQLEGHRRGFKKLEEGMRWARKRKIPHVVVYAFSLENWKRSEQEVSYLMDIFREMVSIWAEKLPKEGTRVRFVGKLDMLPADVQEGIREVEARAPVNPELTAWVCLSYGGRAEITAAAEAAAAAGEKITEDSLRRHFWSGGMPDPDLVIRTGGEQRLSNFLLWQVAYSELFFLKKYWPDFEEKDLDIILGEFARRERRMGK